MAIVYQGKLISERGAFDVVAGRGYSASMKFKIHTALAVAAEDMPGLHAWLEFLEGWEIWQKQADHAKQVKFDQQVWHCLRVA